MSCVRDWAGRKSILPFFIPMQGCDYRCVYCDQWGISGAQQAPSPAEKGAAALAHEPKQPTQMAFYGGSFSALPLEQQCAYLEAVQPALRAGKIDSIRISTRPDALDAAKLRLLADFGVRVVELGVQSFDAAVLQAAGRRYSPAQVEQACALIREAGLALGIQLMTGLPQDTPQQALRSMLRACRLRPNLLRVYPTLVLRHTPLAALYESGRYQPQSLVEAAGLVGQMLMVAKAYAIPVARVGLDPSPSLEQALLAGPYHPAFGQYAKGALKLYQARQLLAGLAEPRLLRFPPRERSLLFGQKNAQWQALAAAYPGLRAEPAPELAAGALAVTDGAGRQSVLELADFARRSLPELFANEPFDDII